MYFFFYYYLIAYWLISIPIRSYFYLILNSFIEAATDMLLRQES